MDLTALVSKHRVKQGGTVTISGTLTDTASGAGLAGATLTLESRPAGAHRWKTVDTVTTGGDGAYQFAPQSPNHNVRYRTQFAGDTTYAGATSQPSGVHVASRVRVKVSPRTVRAGDKVLFTGIVVPGAPGGTVEIQRLDGGIWTTIATRTLDGDSLYAYKWTSGPEIGTFAFRVVKTADVVNVAGFSPKVSVTVR